MKFSTRWATRILISATVAAWATAYAAEANPSDLSQADKFLADLPAACSGSYKYVGSDGAVNIRIICDGNGQKMDGLIVIKNGVVTQVR
uniref:hypothetical protein n=1 Tax=Candidatus Electronema sp. TaxID=2698783 RepID=UPI0040567393